MIIKIKRLYNFVISALAAASVAGCAGPIDEPDTPTETDKTVVYTISRESITPSGKSLPREDGSFWWNASESISVFYEAGEGGTRFVSTNSEPAAVAEFSATVPAKLADSGCWAVYPYSDANSFDGSSFTLTIPSVQTGIGNSFPADIFPAVAKSDQHTMAFKNIGGGLRFSVSRDDIKSVAVKSNSGKTLAGKVKVAIGADGEPAVTEVLEGEDVVTIQAPDGSCFSTSTDYYIVLLPAALDGGITMTFTTEAKEGSFTSGSDRTVKRSAFEVMNEVDKNVAFWLGDDTGEAKLTGVVIGTEKSVDYNTGKASTTVNTKNNVFDGNYNTFFASYDRSNTWVGLDLGEKHVITRIGYSPRIDHQQRVQLAMLEGANQADFSDALPLAIIRNSGVNRTMQYVESQCSRGFRYVRYVSPNDVRCNLSELEFYGIPGEGDDSRLCQLTNLPTVVINTQGAQPIVSKDNYIKSNVYIISDGGKSILSTTQTDIKGRGNASWGFPKKPYKIKFAEKHNVLGSPASAKKWTLINNYGDKTLMRNILAFEVSRRAGLSYTPFCTPVDVILNGEYEGCYQLCDQVEVGKGRVDAKNGYLIEIDAYAYGEAVYFYSNRSIPVTVKYPDDEDITPEQLSFIRDFFGKTETAVFSSNYTNPEAGYRKYLDVDTFLRNFIVGEFCGNTDTYWSVYMYKDGADGVFYTGPVWDYDLAFDNDNRTYPINNLNGFIYATNGSVAAEDVRKMVTRITKTDAIAHARLVELWNEIRPSLESLNDYVDETAALLNESQELNFKRWPIMGQYVHQNPRVWGSYDGEVNNVKSYISRRLTRFGELLNK